MNCKDILQLAPLYLSGEMDENQRDLFRAHLAECTDCSEQIHSQTCLDAQLRDALGSDLPDASAIARSVRAHIAQQRLRRWIMGATAAAAILIAAILGYRALRPERLFSDAALDHRTEVVEHQPRHWRVDPVEIGKLAARYELPGAPAIAPAGYRLEHARICGIDGKPALHLVYTNGLQEFSVFVLRHAGAVETDVRAITVGYQHLAALQAQKLEVIATGGSREECLQLARDVGHAL